MEKENREEIERLWKAFLERRDPSAREGLVMAYLYLVKYVAGKIAIGLPSYVDSQDLFGAGLLGLMQALDKFDPERNIKFETYAIPRIRGAMLDELRSQDWLPRSIRKKAKRLEQAYEEVETRLGRAATDEEIARHMGIPLPDYYDLVDEVCLTTLISLDREISNSSEGLYSIVGEELQAAAEHDPSAVVEEKEIREVVRRTLDGLPEKERAVLSLYYYEDMTLKEIGEVLGISESRVCQVHTKAVMRLRARILQYTKTVSLRRLTEEVKRARSKKALKLSRA